VVVVLVLVLGHGRGGAGQRPDAGEGHRHNDETRSQAPIQQTCQHFWFLFSFYRTAPHWDGDSREGN